LSRQIFIMSSKSNIGYVLVCDPLIVRILPPPHTANNQIVSPHPPVGALSVRFFNFLQYFNFFNNLFFNHE